MKAKTILSLMMIATTSVPGWAQTPVAHFDMSLTDDGCITETVSGQTYAVSSQLPPCSNTGLLGLALRLDGYSNYVRATLPVQSLSTEALTVSMVLASETYPMMQTDAAETTPSYATLCGNLDETAKSGFALKLSSQGDLRLQAAVAYGGGTLITVDGSKKLPRGQWSRVDMVFDLAGNALTLYLDGEAIGSKRVNRLPLIPGNADFYIGKGADDKREGPFLINTFCGLIDDIALYNGLHPKAPLGDVPTPDFNYPSERYCASLWRPLFHAMPSGSWTNETHGMLYSDGRYHLFFQKNANGPYMSRLHWGHVSSADLCSWHEEPIAIYPGEPYDLKGCWSGCAYESSDGTSCILYTGVDNARARIVQARSSDPSLDRWEKEGVVIDGTPAGGFSDFRDPFYFEANGRQYVIVGSGKGGVGCCTLHRFENGRWSNDGTVFFHGTNAVRHGNFWEMPNVTRLDDSHWLFTCTPLGMGSGVRTLCWVGTIGSDGRFTTEGDEQYLEMGGISRDGYGLLSPTILQHGGKTLLLGIVPDKLPSQQNHAMGWAHNYSLPREMSLGADGSLIQQPYSGLTALRTATSYSGQLQLLGRQSLAPVSGRHIELSGVFTVGSGDFGFRFLKSGEHYASLSYSPATGILKFDMSLLERQSSGVDSWSAMLPQRVVAGQRLKLHVYVDGSIADIFVCDRWAFSVRLFPTNASAVEAEAFAEAETAVQLNAWNLDVVDTHPSSVDAPTFRQSGAAGWYDLQGRQLCGEPRKGISIVGGKKILR